MNGLQTEAGGEGLREDGRTFASILSVCRITMNERARSPWKQPFIPPHFYWPKPTERLWQVAKNRRKSHLKLYFTPQDKKNTLYWKTLFSFYFISKERKNINRFFFKFAAKLIQTLYINIYIVYIYTHSHTHIYIHTYRFVAYIGNICSLYTVYCWSLI